MGLSGGLSSSMSVGSISYIFYVIFLLLATGGFLLRIEVKGYELEGMKKEKTVAGFLGWVNIILGVLILIGNWVIRQWY